MASQTDVKTLLHSARLAARALLGAPRSARNAALHAMADALESRPEPVLDANARDVEAAQQKGISTYMVDRLTLNRPRLLQMAQALRDVAALPDPLEGETPVGIRPNGIRVVRRRVPLGVLAVIYEARPNVTLEAAALALKSGNALVLRGGSEAQRTNAALVEVLSSALKQTGLPPAAVQIILDPAREKVAELLGATGMVDLAIPRGGAELMKFVDEHARVPVIRHGLGICHLYLDASAEKEMASRIAFNAKVQRPGVCNSIETLLVHRACLVNGTLQRVAESLVNEGQVELRADPACAEVLSRLKLPFKPVSAGDYDTEFLAPVLALRAVGALDEAMAHIAEHGTNHTAAIVTEDEAHAQRFLTQVDASCVLWNASTRFNDGGELGLGAEMGISTSKMHAYGPMGLVELTAEKFVVYGSGQVRT